MTTRAFGIVVIALCIPSLILNLFQLPALNAVARSLGEVMGAFVFAALLWLLPRAFGMYKTPAEIRGYLASVATICALLAWIARALEN